MSIDKTLQIFEERANKVRENIANNELGTAITQVMDLARDFSDDRKNWHYSINLKATHAQLRQDIRIGLEYEVEERRSRDLRNELLKFIDDLEEEIGQLQQVDSAQPAGASQSLTSTDRVDFETAKRLHRNWKRATVSPPEEKVVFEGKSISESYPSKTIKFSLRPMDLKLRMGEITALVGENGSGKTTLLKIIAGLLEPSGGEISYPALTTNTDKGLSHYYTIKQQIEYIPQDLPKWPGSLAESLTFAAGTRGILGDENSNDVEFIINRLGLEKYKDANWDEISGGYKTRFTLAQRLLMRPKLMVLDEPLANLDIITQNLFLQDLRDLTKSVTYPMAVIISSQHLHEVESVADNIIFLRDGKAVYNGTVAEFGEDRDRNVFEIECELDKDSLLDVIDDTHYISVEKVANHFIIYTRLDTTGNQILDCFIKRGITVESFQDNSKSTKKLFAEHIE